MHTSSDLLYQLALTCVPQIGPVQARILFEHYQTAEEIFRSKPSQLEKIEGIGTVRARSIKQFKQFQEQEEAIKELSKHQIRSLFIKDPDYPRRLLHCYDPPTLLFFKGSADLNASRILSFIGTRSNSDYGRIITEQLLDELSSYNPFIVSGLAYGIDAIAHRKSLQLGIPTLGILAHGLDTIYPSAHYGIAQEMVVKGGGLLSEFRCKTLPDRHHFPSRNRIVAGISDATVVIETAPRGGSMITATLAIDYNRDVFAVPGKINDPKSSGCNQLIAQQKAQLIQSGNEIAEIMGWTKKEVVRSVAKELFVDLSKDETDMLRIFDSHGQLHIDSIHASVPKSSSVVASLLLSLEIKGMIRCLPGKVYQLIQ